VHAGKHKGCKLVGNGPHVHYESPHDFDMLFHFGNYYKLVTDVADKESLGERAAQWLESIAKLVREKNQAYGNSLENPVRIFTDTSPLKLVLARAEDKLSRIMRGNAAGEDVISDLVGYIALAKALGWNGEKLP